MTRKSLAAALTVGVLTVVPAVVSAGCEGSASPWPGGAGPTPRPASPGTVSPGVARPGGAMLGDANTPSSPPATSQPPAHGRSTGSADPFQHACTTDVLLPVVRHELDSAATRFTVERLEVAACRNGYARVFAVSKKVDPPVEGDQLFLRYANGAWHVIDRGASIDCGDSNLKPETATACRALA